MSSPSTRAAAVGMIGIGALHVLWATGSPWPLPDHEQFADVIAGKSAAEAPSARASLGTAGLLATAAAFVDGHPKRVPAASRVGSAGVVAVLVTRGVLGLAGRTDLLSPGSTSERFRRLDRRIYAPLCLALAGLALPATAAPGSRSR